MAEDGIMLDIYIMGRHYRVPEGLTILTALEYCGYRMVRGCGCRAGFCGACATVYNFRNNPQLRFDLACQKAVIHMAFFRAGEGDRIGRICGYRRRRDYRF